MLKFMPCKTSGWPPRQTNMSNCIGPYKYITDMDQKVRISEASLSPFRLRYYIGSESVGLLEMLQELQKVEGHY